MANKKKEHQIRTEDARLLKIDLDLKRKNQSISQLKERLAYMHDLNFIDFDKNIDKIVLMKKTAYACKIYLKKDMEVRMIVIMQLLLGSDYRKEINTLINFYKLKMQYFNRLFDIKIYKGGKIKSSEVTDVTEEIRRHIYNSRRRTNNN